MARASAARLPPRSSLARALMSGILGGVISLVYTARATHARGSKRSCLPSFQRIGNRVGCPARRRQDRAPTFGANMTQAYYTAVLDHPLKTVWELIRDFNNYPAYIEGVSESVIEDDRRGDEVGAVRRFCYLGNWVRQRLVVHSDDAHLLTYAGIEPLPFPSAGTQEAVSPTAYEGTMQLARIVEGNRT